MRADKIATRAAAFAGLLLIAGIPAALATVVCPIPPTGISGASTLCLSYANDAALGLQSDLPVLTNPLGVPGTYIYGNSYAGGTSGGTPITGSTYGFIDDYVFTITSATADAITSTINLGGVYQIDNLSARIYSFSGAPVIGPVAGEIDSTTSGSSVTIAPTVLAAGTYALEISGNANGSAGGSYSGVLQLTAVPLPAAFPLLLCGLGGLVLLGRRRVPLALER